MIEKGAQKMATRSGKRKDKLWAAMPGCDQVKICPLCNKAMTYVDCNIDHIMPKSPWVSEEWNWDVSHTDYADKFYKVFPPKPIQDSEAVK